MTLDPKVEELQKIMDRALRRALDEAPKLLVSANTQYYKDTRKILVNAVFESQVVIDLEKEGLFS